MANIPVERTGGTPWWLWLLGLLLLGLLIWLLIALFDDDEAEVTTVDQVGVVDGATPPPAGTPGAETGAITTFSELAAGTANVGRQVDLDSMRVLAVTGDSSYFVGPGPDPERGALVVLEDLGESETWAPGPEGSDGRYNINEGEVIRVQGQIASFDESTPDYADLPAENRERVLRDSVYINANDITIHEGAGASEAPVQ